MDGRYQYTGDLAEEPLPEVLRTIHYYRVPGVLTVESAGVTKRIYILAGNVIFATSTDRAESLGQYLKKSAVISSGELRASVERLDVGGGRRHGELLVDMGILSDAQLRQIVTEQVKAILYAAFSWEQGSVTFEVGRFKTDELIRLEVPTPQAILDGIRRIADPRRCVSRLGPSWTLFEKVEAPPTETRDVNFTGAERTFLDQVDDRRTLRELITLGPGDLGANAKLFYAFWVLGFVKRREPPSTGIRRIQWKTSGSDSSPGGSEGG